MNQINSQGYTLLSQNKTFSLFVEIHGPISISKY